MAEQQTEMEKGALSPEYGKIVSPEAARRFLGELSRIVPLTEAFLNTYDQFVCPESLRAIEHRDRTLYPFVLTEYYLIGKTKELTEDGWPYEVTLVGSNVIVPMVIFETNKPTIKIGINYDGNDIDFQPRVPEIEHKTSVFALRRNKTENQIPIERKFPLYGCDYGSSFLSEGKGLNPRWEVRDRRLEDITQRMYQNIRASALQSQ